MCLICVDFQRERMTITDARRALREMITTLEPEHAQEVEQMIQHAEQEKREQERAAQQAAQAQQQPCANAQQGQDQDHD